jgi:hypothetical protein
VGENRRQRLRNCPSAAGACSFRFSGRLMQRGQLRAEIRHDLANRGDRPRYVMFLLQQTMIPGLA